MILAIVVLGGTILGATTVAGFLMLFQIRQSTDSAGSARAIFAAGTGIECGLYNFFRQPASPCPSEAVLSNGARYTEETSGSSTVVARGSFGNTRRAVLFRLAGATTTIP